MTCARCGATAPGDARFCPACGELLGAPPVPPPPGSGYVQPSDSRTWATAAHLSAFVALLGVPSFVGPLVVWLVRREQDAYAGEHAREALNFNLSVLVYVVVGGAVAGVLTLATLGIGLALFVPLALLALLGWVVVTAIAATRASNGEVYRYPLTIRFVS